MLRLKLINIEKENNYGIQNERTDVFQVSVKTNITGER